MHHWIKKIEEENDVPRATLIEEQTTNRGVAILIRKNLKDLSTTPKAVNENIIIAEIKSEKHAVCMLGVHVPSDKRAGVVFHQIVREIRRQHLRKQIIVMGDVNTHLGNQDKKK